MIKSLTCALAMMTLAGATQAATFLFSFDNTAKLVSGTVAGSIVLPDGDGTFSPIGVFITAAPPELGYTLDYDVLANMDSGTTTFTVSNSNIVSSNFYGVSLSPIQYFVLDTFDGVAGLSTLGDLDFNNAVVDIGLTTLTITPFAPPAVPLPAAGVLLLGAVGGLAMLRRKPRAQV